MLLRTLFEPNCCFLMSDIPSELDEVKVGGFSESLSMAAFSIPSCKAVTPGEINGDDFGVGVDDTLPGGVLVGDFLSWPLRIDASKLSTDFVLLRNRLNMPRAPPDSLCFDGEGGAISLLSWFVVD